MIAAGLSVPPAAAGRAALDEAVRRGIITGAERDAVLAIEAELVAPMAAAGTDVDRAAAGPRDPENLRFVGGFADVFVTIGLGLFLAGLGILLGIAGLGGSVVAAAVAASAWGLAEYFTRARRMALPSIALLIVFVVAAAVALFALVDEAGLGLGEPGMALLVATGTVLLALLHYRRFRVPIAAGAAAVASVAFALSVSFAAAPDFTVEYLRWLCLAAGLVVFTVAMRFDLSDPERVTRRTDIAFWLHLVAAPLIVRSALPGPGGGVVAGWLVPNAGVGANDAGVVLLLFGGLALVSLVIDRRALLVSGLSFAGYAFWQVISTLGLGGETSVPATLFALGGFILLLSVGWQPLRRMLLRALPERLARRLPRTATG